MSQDFIFAVLLLAVGLVIIGVGAYSAYHQKLYYNPEDKSVVTEVDIPILGKVKTNFPSIALCFIGLVPVYFGWTEMKGRNPTLAPFEGEVAIDPKSVNGIDAIAVGVTSGQWMPTATPDVTSPTRSLNVTISVPDSWPTYTAYAFALGPSQTRPAIIGTSLGNPKFKLRIGP